MNPNASQSNALSQLAPSVPPAIRQLLQLPETAPPKPRRAQRRQFVNGRRVPPGPPPPRSWLSLSLSRHAASNQDNVAAGPLEHWTLPGAYLPEDGSLVDTLLRHMAFSWLEQRDWNRFYLYTMPSRLRTALLYYVSRLHEHGLSVADLRLVLEGPPELELAEYDLERPDFATLNKDVFQLDVASSLGRGVSLKSLTDLLFPVDVQGESDLQDSWDVSEPSQGPVKLLPNLTQLSLAVSPASGQTASWKHLLTLSRKLPTLTHLNLSGWPVPSTTPNATLAKVVSPLTGRATNYGGTNPYSHILDDDWTEAVLVLKRLSKALYGLEYLDLTGCGDWFPALRKEADCDFVISSVDWVGDWGKITTLRLCSGYVAEPGSTSQLSRLWDWKRQAIVVEKHVRAQRAGRGRFIDVESDTLADLPESTVQFL